MTSLEYETEIEKVKNKGIELSEGLLRFVEIMDRIRLLKKTFIYKNHLFSEQLVEGQIEIALDKVIEFSKSYKEDEKYGPFSDLLEDYVLKAGLEVKNKQKEIKNEPSN